ncbi:CDP-6-deoxy-delta-3,4-glucoseen reductase [Arhodomonas aquaeolei]|uniref:CDP-6-deoxy-delta-3,4-glucoseen reductase n=2 Tax=Ectothiorhodospiraceae TaxID=72276 RepID=UPI002169009C|nr:CDP-6-deoxy-delta-3,4-glucoseen reductase [Arhodomonas aquaeolei]MCS4503148.1 CDP-6-deoxy-delta-3,4-glucoseen reductase [Arhodomonas aquaeolei]
MSYRVRIENTQHEFTVEDGEAVLSAALRHGLILPYSCRGGTCGTCMGKVVEGRVSYPDGRPPALSEAEEAVGQALFCQARADSDLAIEVREVRSADDIRPRKLPCRVERMDTLAHDVRRLWLRTPGNERLQFLPGQYVDFLLRGNRRRSFSLANPPHDDELLELHVRQVPDGRFTGYIFEELKERALLRFEGPFGTFFLREDSPRPILMIGGGTGFAPIKSMLEHAFHHGIDRPIHFYWGVRARHDLYLADLPERWAREHASFRYTPVLSEPRAGDQWNGRTGFVHEAVIEDYPDLSGYDVYMSGPPPMIEAAKTAFAIHGLDPGHLYFDSFDFAVDPEDDPA